MSKSYITAMGGNLSQPWRDVPTSHEYSQKRMEHFVFMKYYRPKNNEAKHIRILLQGPVGAGKSSFIDSVDSVIKGRIADRASTDATFGSSHSNKYKEYKISKDEFTYSFVFNDIMGFERKTNHGVPVEDVKLALRGHVKDGYKFAPGCSLTEGDVFYNSKPTLDDRVHVLVSVIPADTITIMSDQVMEKMRNVRAAASDMGIPQMAIITKIDQVSHTAKKDIKNAYVSRTLKYLADELSVKLGLPLKNIFLVKNYEQQAWMTEETDMLILLALRQMINYGEDYLNDLKRCC